MADSRVAFEPSGFGVDQIWLRARASPVLTTALVTSTLFLLEVTLSWGHVLASPLTLTYWAAGLGVYIFAVVAGGSHERLFGLASLLVTAVLLVCSTVELAEQTYREVVLLANFAALVVLGSISLRQGPSWSLAATAFMAVQVAILLVSVVNPQVPWMTWAVAAGLFDVLVLAALFLGTMATRRARPACAG